MPRFIDALVLPILGRALPPLVGLGGAVPGLRDKAAQWLYVRRRSVYERLKQISPAAFAVLETATVNPVWRAQLAAEKDASAAKPPLVAALRDSPNTREAALAQPDLAALPKPLASAWRAAQEAYSTQDEQLAPIARLSQVRRSVVSVGMVVHVTANRLEQVEHSLQSVFRQTDPSWELLLCAAADEPAAAACVDSWLDRDWRIRRVPAQVSELPALRAAAGLCTATYLGLLSAGDVLDDDLVKRVAELVERQGDLQAIYTDEARQGLEGELTHAFHKPGWSPDHQLSVNVLGRFLAVRKSLLLSLEATAWPSGAAAEYLLTVKLLGGATAVGHLPELMYLREAASAEWAERSVGGRLGTHELRQAAPQLAQHLQRSTPAVAVEPDEAAGALRVRWPIPAHTAVTLVILSNMRWRSAPGRGDFLMVLNFVQSIIQKSTYPGYKIIVVDDGQVPEELRNLLHQHGHATATYRAQGAFSFAGKSNFASSLAPEGVVILLNDDLEVIAPDWIEALVEQACRPEVGVVGGQLLFPNRSIQHAGIAIGMNGSAGHVFMHHPVGESEYGGYASVVRNQGAVTGALMAYRTDVFQRLGGFDEFFRVDYNDIDFCLRCIRQGYRVVYTPYAQLYHFHNSTFNRQHDMDHERAEFLRRWQPLVDLDPFCGLRLARLCREGSPPASEGQAISAGEAA